MEYPEPFIDEHMLEEEYFALPLASSHALSTLINRSPIHAKAATSKTTAATAFGRLFHLMLLQPDLAQHLVAVVPEDADKTTNIGKRRRLEWLEMITGQSSDAGAHLAEGKMLSARIKELEQLTTMLLLCSQDEYDRSSAMIDAVLTRNIGRAIFEQGRPEVSMLAKIEGVICKSRMDWLPDGHHLICDVKTSIDAGWETFSRAAARYGYARQAALYRRVHATAHDASEPSFIHCVVESEPPHDVAFFELDEEALSAGNREIDHALYIWAECEKTGIWPGTGWDWGAHEYTIQPLSLPKWAL